ARGRRARPTTPTARWSTLLDERRPTGLLGRPPRRPREGEAPAEPAPVGMRGSPGGSPSHFKDRLPLLEQLRPVDPILARLLLDPQELVVLRGPVGAAGAAGLDLAAVGRYGDVGDRRILGLARAMAQDARPAGPVGHLDGLQRLGQRADLVDLDQ